MIYDLKWMNIKQTLQFNTFMFVRKMKKSNAPKYLCEQIKYVGECQPYTYAEECRRLWNSESEVNTDAENVVL